MVTPEQELKLEQQRLKTEQQVIKNQTAAVKLQQEVAKAQPGVEGVQVTEGPQTREGLRSLGAAHPHTGVAHP